MKHLSKYLEPFFTSTCIVFTMTIALYAGYGVAISAQFIEIYEVLVILLVASVLSLFRVLCYSEYTLKGRDWLFRTVIFYLLSMISVPLILSLFKWVLFSSFYHIAAYFLIFSLLFVGLIGVFEIIYRLQGRRYKMLLHLQQSKQQK